MAYWVLANKPEGTYPGRIWDMPWIFEHQRYSLRKDQMCFRVRVGDIVYLRIYAEAYIGRFVVGGPWRPCPEVEPELGEDPGTIAMADLVLWSPPVPQEYVLHDLSNGNFRRRVIEITREDAELIEAAQRGERRRSHKVAHVTSATAIRDEIAALRAENRRAASQAVQVSRADWWKTLEEGKQQRP